MCDERWQKPTPEEQQRRKESLEELKKEGPARKLKPWIGWICDEPDSTVTVDAESWYEAREISSRELGTSKKVDCKLKEERNDDPPVYEAHDSA